MTSDCLTKAIDLQKGGHPQAALALYQKILVNEPDHESALINAGIIYFQLGQSDHALACFDRAISAHPNCGNAHFNRGYALLTKQDYCQAQSSFIQTIALQPNRFSAYLHLGNIAQIQGQAEEACGFFEKGYSLNRQSLILLNNWAKACIHLNRLVQAEKIVMQALEQFPDQWSLYGNLGQIRVRQWRLPEAEQCLAKALRLNPKEWQLHHSLAAVYHHWNKKPQALDCLNKALALNRNSPSLYSDYLYHLNFSPEYSKAFVFEQHQQWGRQFAAHTIPKSTLPPPPSPLKVGLLSADFCYHPVAVFLLAWLSRINPEKIQFYCYAEVRHRDDFTRMFQNHCQWRETNGKADDQVVEQIQSDGIHLLVDLAGHTKGNRLPIMTYHAAPVQASYLGYINTTGVSEIDFRIVDGYVNPPESQAYYTEKLVYLPDSYTCYRPPEKAPALNQPPVIENGFITFGCFNNPTKLNSEVADLWVKILLAVPHSRLRLKARHFGSPEGRLPIVELFADAGLSEDRLIFEGPSVLEEYFEAHQRVDIALDPFPHNGGTTTHDALFMGVPVITLAGDRYASRMGVSILNNLGHPEWIVDNPENFVATIINLVSNPQYLAVLRKTLRAEFLASPLCDADKFARNIEKLFYQLWNSKMADPVRKSSE